VANGGRKGGFGRTAHYSENLGPSGSRFRLRMPCRRLAELPRPIDWDLIRQQYDEMVKYATALRLGTAETEAILRAAQTMSRICVRHSRKFGRVIREANIRAE
jgi:Tn3 transposase DDE domain